MAEVQFVMLIELYRNCRDETRQVVESIRSYFTVVWSYLEHFITSSIIQFNAVY